MAFRPAHSAEQRVGTIRQPTLKAVIFDLDGVVADSHPVHEIAWTKLLVEQGLDATTLNVNFLYAGYPRRAILKHYLGEISDSDAEVLGRRKDELYAEASSQLKPKPRIPEVIRQLNRDGVVCALATSAGSARTYETLEKFGLSGEFAVIVTGEKVGKPKPSPEIFLLAALKIEADPESCVVVEDSVAGVSAARAAGMKCVGFVPAKWFGELAGAGANDLISEFPENATDYFKTLLIGRDQESVAEARK